VKLPIDQLPSLLQLLNRIDILTLKSVLEYFFADRNGSLNASVSQPAPLELHIEDVKVFTSHDAACGRDT
jgi:hypothetical protein